MIATTGATGQLGRQVINQLLRQGVPAGQIIAVDLVSPTAAEMSKLGVEARLADS